MGPAGIACALLNIDVKKVVDATVQLIIDRFTVRSLAFDGAYDERHLPCTPFSPGSG